MKLKSIIFLLALSSLVPFIFVKAATTPNHLKGRILLQVESKGEAWYVNPKDGNKYYMANGNEAFQIMRNLGLGISNKDLERVKTDANYRKKFIGKILLQVESHGEAYYISFDGRYNYLKDGAAAYDIMRKLGLGISNKDLAKITSKVSNSAAKTELIDKTIAEAKASIPLPYQFDELTTLNDITAESGAIRYHYSISNPDTSRLSDKYYKDMLVAMLCNVSETKELLDQDVNLEYLYAVENSTKTYFAAIAKTDCE